MSPAERSVSVQCWPAGPTSRPPNQFRVFAGAYICLARSTDATFARTSGLQFVWVFAKPVWQRKFGEVKARRPVRPPAERSRLEQGWPAGPTSRPCVIQTNAVALVALHLRRSGEAKMRQPVRLPIERSRSEQCWPGGSTSRDCALSATEA